MKNFSHQANLEIGEIVKNGGRTNVTTLVRDYFKLRGFELSLLENNQENSTFTAFKQLRDFPILNLRVNVNISDRKIYIIYTIEKTSSKIYDVEASLINSDLLALEEYLDTRNFNESIWSEIEGKALEHSRSPLIKLCAIIIFLIFLAGFLIIGNRKDEDYFSTTDITQICLAPYEHVPMDLLHDIAKELRKETGLVVNVLNPLPIKESDIIENFNATRRQASCEFMANVLDFTAAHTSRTDENTVFVGFTNRDMYTLAYPEISHPISHTFNAKRHLIFIDGMFNDMPSTLFTSSKNVIKNRALKLMRSIVVKGFSKFDIPENDVFKFKCKTYSELDEVPLKKLKNPNSLRTK